MIHEKTHEGRTVRIETRRINRRHWDATWHVAGGRTGRLGELAPTEDCAVDEAFNAARRAIEAVGMRPPG